MKFSVVGAGAIGGFLGARLSLTGHDVTFIARGANLAAIKANGFTLTAEDGTVETTRSVKAAAIGEAAPCDILLLAVKAHQVAGLAPDLARLLKPETMVVTLQNGIPWWFFYKLGGEYDGQVIEAVDPGGAIARHIDSRHVIGTVVYPASELTAPGVVRVIEGNRFTLGEPDGSKSERVTALSEALTKAGFKAPISSEIRGEIWVKMMGNVIMNPISALSHATLVDICRYAPTRTLATLAMEEVLIVAKALGIRTRISIEKRIAAAEAIGAHKTSMLQDVEAGRPLELDAMVGSLIEVARRTGTPTPNIDAVFACASLLARSLEEAKGRLRIERMS